MEGRMDLFGDVLLAHASPSCVSASAVPSAHLSSRTAPGCLLVNVLVSLLDPVAELCVCSDLPDLHHHSAT